MVPAHGDGPLPNLRFILRLLIIVIVIVVPVFVFVFTDFIATSTILMQSAPAKHAGRKKGGSRRHRDSSESDGHRPRVRARAKCCERVEIYGLPTPTSKPSSRLWNSCIEALGGALCPQASDGELCFEGIVWMGHEHVRVPVANMRLAANQGDAPRWEGFEAIPESGC